MIIPKLGRRALFAAAVDRLETLTPPVAVYSSERDIPARPPLDYLLATPGVDRISSGGLGNGYELFDWFLNVMCVSVTNDGVLDLADRCDGHLIGYDLAPELIGFGLIEPDIVAAPILAGRVEGDSRLTLTRFYKLSADRT